MVSSTFYIVVPMYIYPLAGVWDPLFSAIDSASSVNWRIVVNPNSGPGVSPGGYPDSSYIGVISQLNTYPNVQTLGYVHTSYGTRALSDVTTDIDAYAGWSAYESADIHVGGIFFDEAPNDTQYLDYMDQASTHARNAMTEGNYVLFNTGVPETATEFYQYADAINAYETAYAVSSTTGENAALDAIPAAQLSVSTIIIHSYDNTTEQLATDTALLMEQGITGLFVTTEESYGAFSQDWMDFVGDVAANL